ncbi:hypothetical protein MSAN_02128800 [Mycena sanguinolenta]|uniref:Uncharacterized protein n=1 Tax=Mycena sanguinolenta TaxID=230812 RepID=A0A8H7CMB8_9AGAR|nr:hypothetical protein MSAN_02128800 [Mycena sanguinolenta]
MPPDASSHLAWVVREFLIIVALSFVCLLAIIQAIQYQFRVFETPSCTEQAPCTPCARVSLHLAALSPLEVLKITTICAASVLISIEIAVRVLLFMEWLPPDCTRIDDAEASTAEAGGLWRDEKAVESKQCDTIPL